MSEKFWYLKSCNLFERLTSEQIEQVEARSKSREFAKNSLIYLPSDRSDSVLLLTSGRVKIYHITAEGKQAVLAFIDPGELFGELAVFESGQRDEFAETMQASTLVMIPSHVIQRLMEAHPGVSLGITRLMGLRRQRIERRLKALLFHSNRERLVHLLLELAEKYGRPTEQGLLIGIKLSHQDLASVIGSTRETVTVLLGELAAERQLIVRRRQIILTEIEQMAASIGSPPPLVKSEQTHARLLRQTQFGA